MESPLSRNYGECSECGYKLVPIWFEEEEYKTEYGMMYRTGRKRRAVGYLLCENCGHREAVDDSFDGDWR